VNSFLKNKIALFCLLLFVSAGFAQDSTMIRKHPPQQRILDKMFIGGNFGLQFGSFTYVEVSPLVGYQINDRISAGVGVTYEYFHYKTSYYNLKTNVYGGRVFGRYRFTENLFGHVEYEYLNLEAFDFYPRRRVGVDGILGGGGYMQRFGRNSSMVAMILYNFTQSVYTPYNNPVIRVGVYWGL
jgi:hypothetical protein